MEHRISNLEIFVEENFFNQKFKARIKFTLDNTITISHLYIVEEEDIDTILIPSGKTYNGKEEIPLYIFEPEFKGFLAEYLTKYYMHINLNKI